MANTKTAYTSKIVAAYLRGNPLVASELPELIRSTYTALLATDSPEPLVVERQAPAVSIRKSITPDAIICLECGKSQKTLKRHLRTAHDLTVDDYRAKWELPSDYPMVAPSYAQHRSQLAVKIGLGRGKAAAATDESKQTEASTGKPQHQYPPSRWSRPAD